MKKLLVLSDLWGVERASWIPWYTAILSKQFEVTYLDSCQLGGVDKSDYTSARLHAQFVNGGIERAARELLKISSKPVYVLGFSVGGTISWKAGMMGLEIEKLVAVSATRLRLENQKPKTKIELIYGKGDVYMPKGEWFDQMEISCDLIANAEHDLYRREEYVSMICSKLGV